MADADARMCTSRATSADGYDRDLSTSCGEWVRNYCDFLFMSSEFCNRLMEEFCRIILHIDDTYDQNTNNSILDNQRSPEPEIPLLSTSPSIMNYFLSTLPA